MECTGCGPWVAFKIMVMGAFSFLALSWFTGIGLWFLVTDEMSGAPMSLPGKLLAKQTGILILLPVAAVLLGLPFRSIIKRWPGIGWRILAVISILLGVNYGLVFPLLFLLAVVPDLNPFNLSGTEFESDSLRVVVTPSFASDGCASVLALAFGVLLTLAGIAALLLGVFILTNGGASLKEIPPPNPADRADV